MVFSCLLPQFVPIQGVNNAKIFSVRRRPGDALATVSAQPAQAVDTVDTTALRNAVTVGGILGHERALQRIANQNDGTRASGTPGYAASVSYAKKTLKTAGYSVKEQHFSFPFFRELAPAELSQVSPTPTDYETVTFDYSASGDVTGALVPTDDIIIPPTAAPSSTSGCEASDFVPASTTEPQVALIQRGTCDFSVKVANAAAAGYDAAVIFNEGQPGRQVLLQGTLGGVGAIPVVGLSFADGSACTQPPGPGRSPCTWSPVPRTSRGPTPRT